MTRDAGGAGGRPADAREIGGGAGGRPTDEPRIDGSSVRAGRTVEVPRPTVLRVESADGIPIACHVTGSGPALVLVHGTGDTWLRWSAVIPGLSRRFRVIAMDRRGRGNSGNSDEYSLAREVEDVVAVLESAAASPAAGISRSSRSPVVSDSGAGSRPYLIGHSFGAICALEAALRTPVGKLVLYEPPIMLSGQASHDAFLARIEGLLARGRLEDIWVSFLRDVMRMPEGDIAQYKSSRSWPARVEMARVLPREARARGSYRFEPARVRSLAVPTLLLSGSLSGPELRAVVDALAAALPLGRLSILPGQNHVAMSSAPELFLREVMGFLQG